VGFGRCFTIGFGWRFTTSDHPTIATRLQGDVDQTIASEATPSFELGTDRLVGTNDCHEIARAHTTQRGNQFYKQAGRKRLGTRVELDVGSYRHAATLSRRSYKI
jgi:hypothetical protein